MLNNIQITIDGAVHRWFIDVQQYSRLENFSLVEDRPFTADEIAWTNQLRAISGLTNGNLLARVKAALATNMAYHQKVANGTAVQADHNAHIQALNRQISALMIFTVLHGDDS